MLRGYVTISPNDRRRSSSDTLLTMDQYFKHQKKYRPQPKKPKKSMMPWDEEFWTQDEEGKPPRTTLHLFIH